MFILTLMLLVGLLGSAAAEAADPIRVSSQSDPQSVISERDVSITIKIYNNSQIDMNDSITLFDPDGVQAEKYNGLGAEQSVTFTGNWHVTSDQISKGKIVYYIRYSINGKEITKIIPVTIQTETAAPQLIASYSISPVSARQGQQMNIAYTLSNTGNIELRDITIKNPGISDKTLTAPSLSVNERIVLEDVFQMGDKEMICEPQITYHAVNASTLITVPDMTRRTLTPAEDGLTLTLTAENISNVYPGESVDLTVKLKNTGKSAFLGLGIVLSDGTEAASGIELAAGASYETTVKYTPTSSGNITATVSGMDAEGDNITIESEPLSITTQDASMALILDVKAAAETDTIYSEPAVVRCMVRVSNLGDTDATTLTVTEAGTPVATISSLPSGETRDVVFDLQTSIAGQLQFVVTGKDAAGNNKSYSSNVITLTYVEPTPVPTNTPAPTAVPPTPSPVPTATPVPALLERAAGLFTLPQLQIGAVVLGVLIVAILIISGITRSKRNKRLKEAIDTIQLTPDVRDPTGRHKRKKDRGKKKDGTKDQGIVSTTDLTEEDLLPKSYAQKTAQETVPNRPEERENTRRRPGRSEDAAEKSNDRETEMGSTMRVTAADLNPDNPQSAGLNDTKTKVFNRTSPEPMEETTKKVPVIKASDLDTKVPSTDPTIRMDRDAVNEVRDNKRGKASASQGKEKKRGFFGKKKKGSDDDGEEYFE